MGLHVSNSTAYRVVFAFVSCLTVCVQAETPIEGHVFYYGWYGNPETDGGWRAWNHQVILREGGGDTHKPPDDIGSNFYPADGLYSSNSRDDVARQMRQLKRAGCGVVAATWWGVDHF